MSFPDPDNISETVLPEDDPVRFAVIGYGDFAKETVVPAIDSVASGHTTVIVTSSPSQVTVDVDHIIGYDKFVEGAVQYAYDAVYIVTPNHTHHKFVCAAGKMGKHVLCEKPLATTVAEAEEMSDICGCNDVALLTGNRVRFKPTIGEIRSNIADGIIGDVEYISTHMTIDVLSLGGEQQWRLQDECGGGALLDLGVYPINTCRYLLDESLALHSGSIASTDTIGSVEAHSSFALKSVNGVDIHCHVSFNAHPSSELHIIGTQGTIKLSDCYWPTVEPNVDLETEETTTWQRDRVSEIENQLEYFINSIHTDSFSHLDGSAGLEDLRIVDEIKEMAANLTTQ